MADERARRARAEDVPGMAELARRAYEPYLPRMAGRRPAPLDADYAHAVGHEEAWVIPGPDGVPRAFVVLVPGERELLLENIAVDPAEQGRGLGRTLLELAERRAVALGATAVRLFTHVSMTENQRIYTARGYVETGRRTEDGYGRVFYRKRLLPGTADRHYDDR